MKPAQTGVRGSSCVPFHNARKPTDCEVWNTSDFLKLVAKSLTNLTQSVSRESLALQGDSMDDARVARVTNEKNTCHGWDQLQVARLNLDIPEGRLLAPSAYGDARGEHCAPRTSISAFRAANLQKLSVLYSVFCSADLGACFSDAVRITFSFRSCGDRLQQNMRANFNRDWWTPLRHAGAQGELCAPRIPRAASLPPPPQRKAA